MVSSDTQMELLLVAQLKELHAGYRSSLRFKALDDAPPDPAFAALPLNVKNLTHRQLEDLSKPKKVLAAVTLERALQDPALDARRRDWLTAKEERRRKTKEEERKRLERQRRKQEQAAKRRRFNRSPSPAARQTEWKTTEGTVYWNPRASSGYEATWSGE